MDKIKLNRVLSAYVVASALIVIPHFSNAQEGDPSRLYDQDYSTEEEYKTSDTYPAEDVQIQEKESKKITPQKKQSEETPKKEEKSAGAGYSKGQAESQSVLSFNFLYYMIQKFKFADVVDQ